MTDDQDVLTYIRQALGDLAAAPLAPSSDAAVCDDTVRQVVAGAVNGTHSLVSVLDMLAGLRAAPRVDAALPHIVRMLDRLCDALEADYIVTWNLLRLARYVCGEQLTEDEARHCAHGLVLTPCAGGTGMAAVGHCWTCAPILSRQRAVTLGVPCAMLDELAERWATTPAGLRIAIVRYHPDTRQVEIIADAMHQDDSGKTTLEHVTLSYELPPVTWPAPRMFLPARLGSPDGDGGVPSLWIDRMDLQDILQGLAGAMVRVMLVSANDPLVLQSDTGQLACIDSDNHESRRAVRGALHRFNAARVRIMHDDQRERLVFGEQ